jgi:hypothetical protein
MIRAVVYNTSSGKVVKILSVSDQDCLLRNIKDGESYILSDWNGDLTTASVVNGAVVGGSHTDNSEQIFKGMRDALLASSDWTQAADSPLSDAKKAEWATYRQQLRDLPANTSDPANPTWPTPPS